MINIQRYQSDLTNLLSGFQIEFKLYICIKYVNVIPDYNYIKVIITYFELIKKWSIFKKSKIIINIKQFKPFLMLQYSELIMDKNKMF